MRGLRRWIALGAWAGCQAVAAQPVKPMPAEEARPAAAFAQEIVRAFVEGCVMTEGDQAAAVDWAVTDGFNPLDAMAPDVEPLLGGKPGTALAMPSHPEVWLVAAKGGPCIVWANRAPGPAVHFAIQQAVSQLAAKGARVQPGPERTLERAGAWRRQLQWRYRRVGGTQDYGIGAVTTLGEQPGAQVLHLERMAPAVLRDPDGLSR